MWTRFNGPFEKFEFTIIKKDNEYVVKTLDEDEFEIATIPNQKKLQLQILDLNGKRISFNDEKVNEWPGEKFLKFHNECFYQKQEENRMKAKEKDADFQDKYDATAKMNVKEWLFGLRYRSDTNVSNCYVANR